MLKGMCQSFNGIAQTHPSRKTCCKNSCNDFCNAINCEERDADACCPSNIPSKICGVDTQEAPCTFGKGLHTAKIIRFVNQFFIPKQDFPASSR